MVEAMLYKPRPERLGKGIIGYHVWLIWKARSTFLYENISIDSNFILNHVGNIVAEYWNANGLSPSEANQIPKPDTYEGNAKWRKPNPGSLKFNVDAAFDESKMEAAVAFVVRDEQGWLLDRRAKIIKVESALEAECQAMVAATMFSTDNEIENVVFESDNQHLINILMKHEVLPYWRCGFLADG